MSETSDPRRAPPSLTLTIDPPVTWQTGKHETLMLKEPTVGQKQTAHEHLRNGTNAATIDLYEQQLVALVSGKPVEVIRLLPVSLMNEAMAYLDHFLEAGRRTTWT